MHTLFQCHACRRWVLAPPLTSSPPTLALPKVPSMPPTLSLCRPQERAQELAQQRGPAISIPDHAEATQPQACCTSYIPL